MGAAVIRRILVVALVLVAVAPLRVAVAAGCTVPKGTYTGQTPWAQKLLDPGRIWPLTTGSGVTVAVVGTGVDPANAQFGSETVLPAIDLLGGAVPRPLPVLRGKLATPVSEKGPMTHFLPARIEWEGREARATQLRWQGSGDIVALALANGFLVVGPERPEIAPGDWVDVLPRRGAL